MIVRFIFFILLLFVQTLPVEANARASGGSLLAYTTGYSFLDSAGRSFGLNYGWQGAQVVDSTRAVAMGTSQPSRYSNSSIMFTVEPGDDPNSDGHNRNEFYGMFPGANNDEGASSGTQYYAISVYVPNTWQDPSWFICFQLHPPNTNTGTSSSPSFSLQMATLPGHYTLSVQGGDVNSVVQNQVDLGPYVYNEWVDFVFEVTWSASASGSVTTWTRVNGVGALQQFETDGVTPIATRSAANLYSASGVTQTGFYWKHGAYRNTGLAFSSIYYSSPVVRAPDFQDAALAAFGQYP